MHQVLRTLVAAVSTPSPSATAAEATVSFPSWAWFGDFLTSPAIAGIAALVAAIIAFKGIQARIAFDRTEAETNRAADKAAADALRLAQVDDANALREQEITDRAAAHWWDMYQWAIAHLDELVKDVGTGQALLRALALQAPGKAERKLVLVAIDMLLARGGSTP